MIKSRWTQIIKHVYIKKKVVINKKKKKKVKKNCNFVQKLTQKFDHE